MQRPRQILDLGFPEELGKGLLHDGFRVAAIEAAPDDQERCRLSYEYLRKVLKHGGRMAEETGDHELADLLRKRYEWVTNQILLAVSDLEADLRERRYELD
ncbi:MULTISPECIES: hypothetical protein [Nonomuraea]|uniref:Uncharacterized protein n=1 Tax=Nonomuraea africana TaxID=46171 RepID=A0ABR9KRD4_9ACTN|nr:hypothetical protein [Nonomuraea africana]MBE1564595.1 hypothetical protein [Nonomuraea africana]